MQCTHSLVSQSTAKAQKDVSEKCEEGGNGDFTQMTETAFSTY